MQRPLKKGRLRRWFGYTAVILLALAVVTAALAFSREPAARRTAAPTSDTVRRAQLVFERVQRAQRAPGTPPVRLTPRELDALAIMAARAARMERVEVVSTPDHALVKASHRTRAGLWINASVTVSAGSEGAPRIDARIGSLPMPGFVVRAATRVGLRAMRARGVAVWSLEEIVPQVRFDEGGVWAKITVPSDILTSRKAGSRMQRLVTAHYCRLIAQEDAADPDFARLMRSTFAQTDGGVDDNRAAFVALSMYTAQFDGGVFSDAQEAQIRRCGSMRTPPRLQGREDLAKHWAVSATMVLTLGTDASLTIGEWKEISDSGSGGSGFSLVDLSADRSGAFCAHRATDPLQAKSARDWLASATAEDLVPVAALAMAEGLGEEEFRRRYADTTSASFTRTVRSIDETLAVLLL